MPFYAILIVGGVLALLGAFLLGGDDLFARRRRASSGYDSHDTGDGGWSFGGPTDYNDGDGGWFGDD